jgi:hypothetical protein
MTIFYITQKISDPMVDIKDRLPTDTTNCFRNYAERWHGDGKSMDVIVYTKVGTNPYVYIWSSRE